MKTAVIDIGTNTLLLLIVDEQKRRVVDLCRFGRLGKGLDASGNLAAESVAKSLEICREYRAVMDQHGVATPRVIGTQALREAANAGLFVAPAEEILRAKLEVIDGLREAALAFRSVEKTFTTRGTGTYIVVDVGGGSTELIWMEPPRVALVGHNPANLAGTSLPIGAVRLTERHLKSDPPTSAELAALEADIDQRLEQAMLPSGKTIVGTAGTATTLAAVSLALAPYDPDRVTGLELTPGEVQALYQKLARATIAERKAMVGMEPQRADVIVGGAAIYARIMARTNSPVFVACDRGIRWGLVYES